jgi:hypothetical protein
VKNDEEKDGKVKGEVEMDVFEIVFDHDGVICSIRAGPCRESPIVPASWAWIGSRIRQ